MANVLRFAKASHTSNFVVKPSRKSLANKVNYAPVTPEKKSRWAGKIAKGEVVLKGKFTIGKIWNVMRIP